jgi:hypothetical protein
MRLLEDVRKQADLIEQACRAGLQDFAAELAVESPKLNTHAFSRLRSCFGGR